jgi:thiamine biosynthesis lipoprotein
LNKKIILTLLIIAAISVSAILIVRTKINSDYLTTEIYSMNTIIVLKIAGKDKQAATNAIVKEINYLNEKFDDFSSESDISKINNNAGKAVVQVDKATLEIISESLQLYKETEGAFNITVAPISKLWGFKSGDYNVPPESEINDSLKLVNINDLIIQGNTIMLKKEGEAIDLGGIAKGFALDQVKQILPEYNLMKAVINMGGNVFTYGYSGKENWLIGVKNPRGDGEIGTIKINGSEFVSTSGDYERFFIENNKRYCHIIDPSTGYPADKIISVTVISDKGYEGDALSTAFFVLGKDKALELAKKLNVQIIGFDANLKPFFTEGIQNAFTLEEG